MKELKQFLREWGFHHSWGYWISDTNKNIKAKIGKGKNTCYIAFTKDGFTYHDSNKFFFHVKEKDKWDPIREDIINRIMNWL